MFMFIYFAVFGVCFCVFFLPLHPKKSVNGWILRVDRSQVTVKTNAPVESEILKASEDRPGGVASGGQLGMSF